MRKLIECCPACGGEMAVTRQNCLTCSTEISGQFATTVFDRLSPESLAFVETFVRLRGNIKEMERELGVPYNAVRNRLDEVIHELGFEGDSGSPLPEPERTSSRKEILDRLDRGEINASEAADLLSQIRK